MEGRKGHTILNKFDLLEHHGEFLEGVLADTRLVAGLDLLFQVVLHAHSQLVELIPLLGKSHRALCNINYEHQKKIRT